MPKETLTSRVARLERIVAELVEGANVTSEPRAALHQPGRDDWMKVVGAFDGDEEMKQICARGAAIRRAERREARRR